MTEPTIAQALAYTFNKLGREGLEALLSQNSSYITKETITDCIDEYRAIGLTDLAAVLEGKKEKAPNKEAIRFCSWHMAYRSREDMESCRLPNGTCGCLINREY